MIVYHGSDIIVQAPDIAHSAKHLDFGPGFYVTTNPTQAERWAKRKAAVKSNTHGIINVYEMSDISGYSVMVFGDDLDIWIDFVCDCRNGSSSYKAYDIIIGKVANDKVFRVVDMYKRGIWDKDRALKEIRVYKTYDQIAFITQDAINSILTFKESIEVTI